MDSVRFEQLAYLHALWAVAALLGVMLLGSSRRRAALRRFADVHLLPFLAPDVSPLRRGIKSALVLTALVGIVLALIDPRWGLYFEDVKRRGNDVIFVLDVSRSMLAEDASPNRLERAKQYIRDVLEGLGGDRVGLVTFAGEAALQCPLTIDYGAMRMVLDEVDTRSGTRGGSLLGDAVRRAADSFADELRGHKSLIVLSDGEDMDSYPVEAAREIYEKRGIRVYTVGLGDSATGARIPVTSGGPKTYLEHEGQQVWSRMNPAILEQMALAAGGAFIPAGTSMFDLAGYYNEKIVTADQREFEARQVQRYHVQFLWFAAPALLLLLIESILSTRRSGANGQAIAEQGASG